MLKVIDQGSDDTTNAVSIRRFFERTAAVTTTTHTGEASIIQTRHRIPEQPLREDQIMVYQVPMPEPLRWLEPSEKETRTLHALEEYGIMSIPTLMVFRGGQAAAVKVGVTPKEELLKLLG